MPAPAFGSSSSGPSSARDDGPHLPEVHVSRNVMRQVRTLLLCSTSPTEHLANLHVVEQPSTRTSSPTLSIATLSLPDAAPPSSVIHVALHAGSAPSSHPRRWSALSLPLAATASLSGSAAAVTLQARSRTFRHALDGAVVFDARDGRKMAQTALGIVLAGGSPLRPGERVGLLGKRGNALEALPADDDDADEGVWTLGGGQAEVWKALAGLAELRAKRRNKRLGRRATGAWVAREVCVVRFDENGAAWIRHGWMRVLCGQAGVERYSAEIREVDGRFVGRFLREGGRRRVRVGATGGARATVPRELRTRPEDVNREARRLPTHGGERKNVRREVEFDLGPDDETSELGLGPNVTEEVADEVRPVTSAEVTLTEEDFVERGAGLGSSDDDTNGSDDDRTMEAMCRKYLNVGYAEEVRRRLERLS